MVATSPVYTGRGSCTAVDDAMGGRRSMVATSSVYTDGRSCIAVDDVMGGVPHHGSHISSLHRLRKLQGS